MRHRLPSRQILAVVLLVAALSGASVAAADIDRINDCGVNCLYVLLRLDSRDVDLAELRRALPHPGEEGLSMADLRNAAARFGTHLRGARLRREDLPLDRPVIALLGSEGIGHFVVLEPVGTTGTMAMLLDFPGPPRIVDYSSLLTMRGWNGFALVPVRPWERALPYAVGITASVLVPPLIYAPWRRRLLSRRFFHRTRERSSSVRSTS
jgi:hypothetical protein